MIYKKKMIFLPVHPQNGTIIEMAQRTSTRTRRNFMPGVVPPHMLTRALEDMTANIEAQTLSTELTIRDLQHRIEKGLDVNPSDKYGNTTLSKAIRSHASTEVIKFLLDQGSDPNQYLEYDDKTLLMLAVIHKNGAEVIRLLVRAGADVNQKNERNYTALYYACRIVSEPDIEVVKALVYSGATIPKDEYSTDYLMCVPYNHPKYEQFYKLIIQDHHEAAQTIQRKMKHWLWSPYTRDGKVGLMPAKIYRDLCDTGFIKK
jgi:uncharacterized protein